MKKFIMALMLCLVSILSVNAETIYGYTTDLMVWNGYRWESTGNGYGIPVTLVDNKIYISSSSPQVFRMYNISDEHINASGHPQFTAKATDQDGVTCSIRIVYRDDIEAPMQIYISYSNISYVYNVRGRN